MNQLTKELERLEARDQRELLDRVATFGDDLPGFIEKLNRFRGESCRYTHLNDDEFIKALKRNDERFERACGVARKLGYEGNQDGIDDMLASLL